MLKLILVGSVFALTVADIEKELPARKNVAELFQSRHYSRRLGKSSSGDTSTSASSGGKWSTSDSSDSSDVSDDGMCGCSDYLDDSSSSSSSWSSGKKSSSTGTKTWSSGKKSSGSGSGKWSTDTTMSTTSASSTAGPTLAASNNGTDAFCDCLCACNEGNSTVTATVTSSTTSTDRRRNRRLGSGSGKWSTSGDGGGCGSTTWSSGKKSSTSGKKNSASGKKNSASKSSGKWSTDTYSTSSTTSEPCYTTTETPITCQCGNTSMNGTTEAPAEEESTSSTTMETPAPTEEGCAEDSDYMVLGIGWEYYLSSTDKSVVLSGRYNQDGTEFINENDESLVLWWESVGTDHVFIVGNQSNSLYQLSYKDLVSTWTDNDNPLTDSDDENEWDAGDDTAEFITGNITLYDCEGNNLGTDVYTQNSHEYYSQGMKLNYGIVTMFAGLFMAVLATLY